MIVGMEKMGVMGQTHQCEYTRIRDGGSPGREEPVLLRALQRAG